MSRTQELADLEYLAQMSALEGLQIPEELIREYLRLKAAERAPEPPPPRPK